MILVSFHAHPDDEALLTGGTLARAAAEGHRVVLVVATLGGAGLAADPRGEALAARRHRELLASAAALGCARVEVLGYDDSGLDGAHPAARRFADAPAEQAAHRLAAILRAERADVLTSYDVHGGYGHPDHLAVHRVGARAAELADVPVVLEATIDRDSLRLLLRALGLARRWLPALPLGDAVFTPRAEITHSVDVRRYLPQKRAALRAHVSQGEGGRGPRTITTLLRLPGPLFTLVAGREWFVQRGEHPAGLRSPFLEPAG
ncbi:PIG-L deacetylase family protein [Cryptosporangium arvum]|uniref:Putative LmbE-like protein n=1 Tax=Cryptosporangium arvum DSM 44712 TaxID=927661 RepID=A0A010ZZE4_9ACTN|nr:PIG-L family deacetylase [Cryptosporangium arvum]EXG82592.1 putative LmbE-like protein [Cryptosporangium arvum DSM 44712]